MDYSVLDEFFCYDLKIKRILLLSAHKSEESFVDYSDKISKALNDIEFYFFSICDKLSLVRAKSVLDNKFSFFKDELNGIGSDLFKLLDFYEMYFCCMRDDFIDEINGIFVGYSGLSENDLCEFFDKSLSINEILHVFHQYIVNNEEILESIPVIEEKKYNNDYPICLRGNNNRDAIDIYNCLSLVSHNGYTDIVSLDSKIIIMVRDRGHALTLEIEKENDVYYVQYFIPKVCNMDMVNSLPGVRKLETYRKFTDGMFVVSENDIASKVSSFIESVPNDRDMSSNNFGINK